MNEDYWTKRYIKGQLGWDIGYVSTPIKEYFDRIKNKEFKILIPGSGNAYEAEYLYNNGFHNTYIVDISNHPLEKFHNRVPQFPTNQILHQDFFTLTGQFDFIIEQTFFCAIEPELRKEYVHKVYDLLKPEGKVVGLLFNIPLYDDRPPFGGSQEEYIKLFSPYFEIEKMETAYNSIPERMGNELFILLKKKTSI